MVRARLCTIPEKKIYHLISFCEKFLMVNKNKKKKIYTLLQCEIPVKIFDLF